MAACEYSCSECDWADFSNDPITKCPICCASVGVIYDEASMYEDVLKAEQELNEKEFDGI